MYNRRYEKIVRMLRQETAGYALGNRPPWGSCVLEIKNGRGSLLLTVQGLRPLRQGKYGAYILAGEESIFCGTLTPDAAEGYGALKWEFLPDALGTGRRAEEIHTAVILAESGENGSAASLSAALVAFFDEERDWRAMLVPPAHEKPIEKPDEPHDLRAAEAAVLPQKMPQNTNVAVAQAQQSSYHGSFRGLLAKFRQELRELEDTGILSAQETEKIRQSGTKPPEKTAEEAVAEEVVAEEAVAEEVLEEAVEEKAAEESSPFAKNRELQPFAEGEGWKCVSLAELTLLPQVPLQWQRAFFFLLAQRRYHHLILRETEDGIWLGLPALYAAEDAAEAQKFGFAAFHRVEGEQGYWLARLEKD